MLSESFKPHRIRIKYTNKDSKRQVVFFFSLIFILLGLKVYKDTLFSMNILKILLFLKIGMLFAININR